MSKDVDSINRVAAKVVDLEVCHLVRQGIQSTPLPGAPTIDKRCSAVHRGVSHDGRFVIEVRVIKNKKATETQELDRFGPSA